MSINLNIDNRRKIYNTEHNNELSFWDLVFWQNSDILFEKEYFDVAFDFLNANKKVNGAGSCLCYLNDLKKLSDGVDLLKDGNIDDERKDELKELAYKYDRELLDGRLYYVEELKKLDPNFCGFEKNDQQSLKNADKQIEFFEN